MRILRRFERDSQPTQVLVLFIGPMSLSGCRSDEGEHVNIAVDHPDIVDHLEAQLASYKYVFRCCLLCIYMPAIDRSLSDLQVHCRPEYDSGRAAGLRLHTTTADAHGESERTTCTCCRRIGIATYRP